LQIKTPSILAELKETETLSMSFDNEFTNRGKRNEYVIRLGYRFRCWRSQLVTDPSGIIKGDINLKMDFLTEKTKLCALFGCE
jgi:hypothetical protein